MMFLCKLVMVLVLVALLSIGVLSLELLQRFVNWFQESRNMFEITYKFVMWYVEHGNEAVEDGVQRNQEQIEEYVPRLSIEEEELGHVPGMNSTQMPHVSLRRNNMLEYQARIDQLEEEAKQSQERNEQLNQQIIENETIMKQLILEWKKSKEENKELKLKLEQYIQGKPKRQLQRGEMIQTNEEENVSLESLSPKDLQMLAENNVNNEPIFRKNQFEQVHVHNFQLQRPLLLPKERSQTLDGNEVPNELLQDTTLSCKE